MFTKMLPTSLKHVRKMANGRRFSIDVEAGIDNNFVSLASKKPANDHLKLLVNKSWQGMMSGCSPTLCEAGVGGTYFMKDSFNKRIGVFKPHDEEMGCSNNPKGYLDGRTRVVGGEAAFRECAAYVLDHEHYAGVPATDLIVCSYPCFFNSPSQAPYSDEYCKLGSFQEFKEHDFDTEDISPSKAACFPVNEVHKIALFDIRLFNTDRHGGNILVRKVYSPDHHVVPDHHIVPTTPKFRGYGSDIDENSATQFSMDLEYDDDFDVSNSLTSSCSSSSSVSSYEDNIDVASYELIPIDHGYTLPSTIHGITDSWFEWLNWPQAKLPFTVQSKEYIANLDAESDVALLREKFSDWFLPETYRVLRVTTMWLKKGAAYDLTPYELGTRMCSLQTDMPSELESIYYAALDPTNEDEDDLRFYENVSNLMDEKMKDIVLSRGSAPQSRSLKYAH